MGRWLALTGTPGTGKSAVARFLPASWTPVEVGEIAERIGAARPAPGGGRIVDVRLLRERWPRTPLDRRVVVGHLAHLLPVRDVVVLRCEPLELFRRLRHRRLTLEERYENVAAEAIDLILSEARSRRRRIWEIDTTRRSPRSVARAVVRAVRSRPVRASVDWLADPRVTNFLGSAGGRERLLIRVGS